VEVRQVHYSEMVDLVVIFKVLLTGAITQQVAVVLRVKVGIQAEVLPQRIQVQVAVVQGFKEEVTQHQALGLGRKPLEAVGQRPKD
jgi:hypothetical protein